MKTKLSSLVDSFLPYSVKNIFNHVSNFKKPSVLLGSPGKARKWQIIEGKAYTYVPGKGFMTDGIAYTYVPGEGFITSKNPPIRDNSGPFSDIFLPSELTLKLSNLGYSNFEVVYNFNSEGGGYWELRFDKLFSENINLGETISESLKNIDSNTTNPVLPEIDISPYVGSKCGIPFHTKGGLYPLNVDLDKPYGFQVKNGNKFICGPDGSGRSVLLSYMLNYFYSEKQDDNKLSNDNLIFVITHGGNFHLKGLAGISTTYNIGLDNVIKFNPFLFIKSNIDLLDISRIMTTLWYNLSSEKFEHETFMKISEQLVKSISCFVEQTDSSKLSLTHFISFLQEQEKIDSLHFDLNKFKADFKEFLVGGKYENLFAASDLSNWNIDRFTIFNVDGLTDNPTIYQFVVSIISLMFIDKMRGREGRKILVYDKDVIYNNHRGNYSHAMLQYAFNASNTNNGEVWVVSDTPSMYQHDNFYDPTGNSPVRFLSGRKNSSPASFLLDFYMEIGTYIFLDSKDWLQNPGSFEHSLIEMVLGKAGFQMLRDVNVNENGNKILGNSYKYKEFLISVQPRKAAYQRIFALKMSNEELNRHSGNIVGE